MKFFDEEIDFDDFITKAREICHTDVPRIISAKITKGMTYEECVEAMYAVFDVEGINKPELNIINREPKEHDSEHIFPSDIFVLCADEANNVTKEEIMNAYRANRTGAEFVFSFDKLDRQRVVMNLAPEGMPDFANNNHLTISIFNGISDEQMNEFMKKWDKAIRKRRS